MMQSQFINLSARTRPNIFSGIPHLQLVGSYLRSSIPPLLMIDGTPRQQQQQRQVSTDCISISTWASSTATTSLKTKSDQTFQSSLRTYSHINPTTPRTTSTTKPHTFTLNPTQTRKMSTSTSSHQPSQNSQITHNITPLRSSDYEEWHRLFAAYIAFYNSSIPDTQYTKTFARLMDPKSDLYGLVLRDPEDEGRLIGLAHFFPHQTPWDERAIMHFNDLFIDPNVRSKGYGRAMIMAVAEQAKAHGCFRLEWATRHENATARRLYDTLATCEFVEYRMKF